MSTSTIHSISSRQRRDSRMKSKEIPSDSVQHWLETTELDYPSWWSWNYIQQSFKSIPESGWWNFMLCLLLFLAHLTDALEVYVNLTYILYVAAVAYNVMESTDYITFCTKFGFVLDFITFLKYAITVPFQPLLVILCDCLRLHRPLRYLWFLNDYNLRGSVMGTTFKYLYICLVLRVGWVYIWIIVNEIKTQKISSMPPIWSPVPLPPNNTVPPFHTFFFINKMFIPVGPPIPLEDDVDRIMTMLVMTTGWLTVSGAAVASLCSIFTVYLRPEEDFRTRYRLIMKEMIETEMPAGIRDKVETFYKMYWHKQRAVSEAMLMKTFPPTIRDAVQTDIYFEAIQKNKILRDVSYGFLTEIAKCMETIHYIPGDALIKRSSKKSSIIYISYGDVEMLTAEDDMTAILRMTRGTLLSGGAGCVQAACARAHVDIRAATFCTAHQLRAADLWRAACTRGRITGEANVILAAFNMYLDRVKRHYSLRVPEQVKYKSSILHFKQNLMALKEATDSTGQPLLAKTDVFLEIAGCYIMRNREDASLSDEADAICLRPTFPCILQPSSSLQVAWNFVIAVVIFAVCITHPYYLLFTREIPLEFRFFDYFATVIFAADLVVHLSTGANVEEGVPITFAQTSSQQMQSCWFVLDVFATLPIFAFIGDGHFTGMNKLLRLPKLFRILKSMEEVAVYYSNCIRFASYTLLFLITCYLIAALQQAYMCFGLNYCTVKNFTTKPFWYPSQLDEETIEDRVVFSLYWAISTMSLTSHQDAFDMNEAPRHYGLFTVVLMELCMMLHMFVESIYSATIVVTTDLSEQHMACITNVKNIFMRTGVDPLLQKRFIAYLQLCWHTDKAYAMTHKKSILFDLPAHVYQDILAKQRSKYILCIPFMKLFKHEDLKNISSKARIFYTSPNEILMNTGDYTNEIYIIKQGICELLNPDTKDVEMTLGKKETFGVIECVLRVPAFYTVRAVTHVQVFSVARKHLLAPISTVPHIKDAIDFAKKQPEFKSLLARREQFISYEPPKPAPNRWIFRQPRKHEQDTEFLRPFHTIGFFSVLRYIFPRFTIRPDGRYLMAHECVRAVCALVVVFIVPGYTYLVLQFPFLYYVVLLLDLMAYFDIVQRMLVGYYNARGILVSHPASTAVHYLKGAFIIDLLGCLPLESLDTPRQERFRDWCRVTRTRQDLMMNRLLQLYRLPSAMVVLTPLITRRDILVVVKSLPLMHMFLNILTSKLVLNSVSFYFPVRGDNYFIDPMTANNQTWITLVADQVRYNITETPYNLHMTCYFWVVYEATTTGYNTFRPTSVTQMIVLFFSMVIGSLMLCYIAVRIISIRGSVNTLLADSQEHMKDMITYMKQENLPKELLEEMVDYYENTWEKTGGVHLRSVLKLCDQITLRTDAITDVYGSVFAKCPLLAKSDISLLRLVGRAIHSVHLLADTTISEIDDILDDLYFVADGYVEVVDSFEHIEYLYTGSIFGNLERKITIRCPVSFVAMTNVHLLQINTHAFYEIIVNKPNVLEMMSRLRPNHETFIVGESESIQNEQLKSEMEIQSYSRRLRFQQCLDKAHQLVQLYMIAVSLGSVYLCFYKAGFEQHDFNLRVAMSVFDVLFYIKIAMYFIAPYLVHDRTLKAEYRKNMQSYRKSFLFACDILSVLPIELISLSIDQDDHNTYCLLQLNRVLRVVTVHHCLKTYRENLNANLLLMAIGSVGVWLLLIVHAVTCTWHLVGLYEEKSQQGSSWMYKDDGTSWCDSHYMCSLYFVFTSFTMNGVGDIMPRQINEVKFVSVLLVISTMLYMVFVGEFANIIQYKSYRYFAFFEKYKELKEFLKNNRVTGNVVGQVKKYALHLWRESRGQQLPHFVKTAPNCLRLRVMSAAYMEHLTSNIVFETCERALLKQIVGCFQNFTYEKDMFVVKEGEVTDSMYIIHTGQVLEFSEAEITPPRTYRAGEVFGLLQGLTYNVPYPDSYRTTAKSQILTLCLSDWEKFLHHFPKCRKSIDKHLKGIDPDDDTQRSSSGHSGPDDGDEKYAYVPSAKSTIFLPEEASVSLSKSKTSVRSDGISKLHVAFSDKNIPHQEKSYEAMSLIEVKDQATSTHNMSPTESEKEVPEAHARPTTSGSKFMKRISNAAKKFIGLQSMDSLGRRKSEIFKDSLFIEDDEKITDALIQKLKKESLTPTEPSRSARIGSKTVFKIDDNREDIKSNKSLQVSDSRKQLQKLSEANKGGATDIRKIDNNREDVGSVVSPQASDSKKQLQTLSEVNNSVATNIIKIDDTREDIDSIVSRQVSDSRKQLQTLSEANNSGATDIRKIDDNRKDIESIVSRQVSDSRKQLQTLSEANKSGATDVRKIDDNREDFESIVSRQVSGSKKQLQTLSEANKSGATDTRKIHENREDIKSIASPQVLDSRKKIQTLSESNKSRATDIKKIDEDREDIESIVSLQVSDSRKQLQTLSEANKSGATDMKKSREMFERTKLPEIVDSNLDITLAKILDKYKKQMNKSEPEHSTSQKEVRSSAQKDETETEILTDKVMTEHKFLQEIKIRDEDNETKSAKEEKVSVEDVKKQRNAKVKKRTTFEDKTSDELMELKTFQDIKRSTQALLSEEPGTSRSAQDTSEAEQAQKKKEPKSPPKSDKDDNK